MEEIVGLHVRLLKKGIDEPLTGGEYSVKFYDKDIFKDNYLGESLLDDLGHTFVSVTRSDFRSWDSPLEKYPDVYFTLHKNGLLIYKSPICKDIHLEEAFDFPTSDGLHCNLGTFMI